VQMVVSISTRRECGAEAPMGVASPFATPAGGTKAPLGPKCWRYTP
jgi:hypothetical protein